VEHDDGVFWELTAHIDATEAQTRAADELAGERPSFAELVRRVPVGEVVSVVTVDGGEVRGRVMQVGRDVVRVGEVNGDGGTSGRRIVRCHDIRLVAVVRVVREPGA
jgi:hypothetical protein